MLCTWVPAGQEESESFPTTPEPAVWKGGLYSPTACIHLEGPAKEGDLEIGAECLLGAAFHQTSVHRDASQRAPVSKEVCPGICDQKIQGRVESWDPSLKST